MTARYLAISIVLTVLATGLVPGSFDTVTTRLPTVASELTAPLGLCAETLAAGDEALTNSLDYTRDRALFDEAFEYFKQIGFESEYGTSELCLKRWKEPINISIEGRFTKDDYAVLSQLVSWLNQIEGVPLITIVPAGGNHKCMFYPLADLERKIDDFPPGNWALTSVWWDADNHIINAFAAVSTDMTNQFQRNHLIQEECIQSLGLLQDNYDYQDSIFQEEWTETQHPIAVDFAMIRMLYSPALKMSMNVNQAYKALLLHYGLA